MNVAQISTINGSVTDGTSMRVSGLSRCLHETGHSVLTVCASGSRNLPGNFEKTDVRFMRLLKELYGHRSPLEFPFIRHANLRSTAHRIISPLFQDIFDRLDPYSILHCHEHSAASIVEGKKRRGDQRLLFDFHGLIFDTDINGAVIEQVGNRRYSRVSKWEQRVFRDADMISFVSALLRDRIVELKDIDIDKTCVIPDGVDYTHISKGWNRDSVNRLKLTWGAEDSTVVMYIGTLDPLHGGNYLMDAFANYSQELILAPNLKCVIVGLKSMAEDFARLQTRFPGGYIRSGNSPHLAPYISRSCRYFASSSSKESVYG